MKISISSQIFDLDNYILLENVLESGTNYENYTRRVNRTATLDSGVVIQDNGYNHGDRTLTFQAEVTQSQWSILRDLVKNYSVLTLTTPDGAYQGSLAVENNYGIATLTFMVESSLSDWTEPTTTTTTSTTTSCTSSQTSTTCSTTTQTSSTSTVSSHTTQTSTCTSTHTTSCTSTQTTTTSSTESTNSSQSTISSQSTESTESTSSSTISSISTSTTSTTRLTTSCSSTASTISSISTQSSTCSTISSISTVSTTNSTESTTESTTCSTTQTSTCSTISSHSTTSSTISSNSTLSTQSSTCSTISTGSTQSTTESSSSSTVTCSYNDYFNTIQNHHVLSSSGGASISLSGSAMKITIPNSTDAAIRTQYKYLLASGDFDVRVDIVEYSPEDVNNGLSAYFWLTQSDYTDFAHIRYYLTAGTGTIKTDFRTNGADDVGGTSAHTPTKFRITRIGTVISVYYFEGGQWNLDRSKDFGGTAGDIKQIHFYAADTPIGGNYGGYVRFDNLVFYGGCPDGSTTWTSTSTSTTVTTTPPPPA